jgi:hypothetical protein
MLEDVVWHRERPFRGCLSSLDGCYYRHLNETTTAHSFDSFWVASHLVQNRGTVHSFAILWPLALIWWKIAVMCFVREQAIIVAPIVRGNSF